MKDGDVVTVSYMFVGYHGWKSSACHLCCFSGYSPCAKPASLSCSDGYFVSVKSGHSVVSVKDASSVFSQLTSKQRLEIMDEYCRYCGDKNPCNCLHDHLGEVQ
jgi:hypothetical protein